MAEAFLRSVDGDPVALLQVLDTSVDTPVEDLARIDTPTLVAVGADDVDHASAERLAERAAARPVRRSCPAIT